MTNTAPKGRIPKAIDQGKHADSCMSYLWHNYNEHQELLASNQEPLLTAKADRYACGFPLPAFQRKLCWTISQEIAFIESAWLGLPLGTYIHHLMDWGHGGVAIPYSGWLIDGQQRLSALQRYWDDQFSVFGLRFSELTKVEHRRFMSIKFAHYESSLWDEGKIRELYNRLAFGGTPHKDCETA